MRGPHRRVDEDSVHRRAPARLRHFDFCAERGGVGLEVCPTSRSSAHAAERGAGCTRDTAGPVPLSKREEVAKKRVPPPLQAKAGTRHRVARLMRTPLRSRSAAASPRSCHRGPGCLQRPQRSRAPGRGRCLARQPRARTSKAPPSGLRKGTAEACERSVHHRSESFRTMHRKRTSDCAHRHHRRPVRPGPGCRRQSRPLRTFLIPAKYKLTQVSRLASSTHALISQIPYSVAQRLRRCFRRFSWSTGRVRGVVKKRSRALDRGEALAGGAEATQVYRGLQTPSLEKLSVGRRELTATSPSLCSSARAARTLLVVSCVQTRDDS